MNFPSYLWFETLNFFSLGFSLKNDEIHGNLIGAQYGIFKNVIILYPMLFFHDPGPM